MSEFFEWFGGDYYKGIISVVSILGGIGSILLIQYRKRITRENLKSISTAFNVIVAGLSSKSLEVRMSSAILLRRFLDPQSEYGVGGIPFAKSTVSVIAAICD